MSRAKERGWARQAVLWVLILMIAKGRMEGRVKTERQILGYSNQPTPIGRAPSSQKLATMLYSPQAPSPHP